MRFFASNGSVGLDGYDIHEVGDDGVGQRVLTIYAWSSGGQAGKDRARAAVALVVDDLNTKADPVVAPYGMVGDRPRELHECD